MAGHNPYEPPMLDALAQSIGRISDSLGAPSGAD